MALDARCKDKRWDLSGEVRDGNNLSPNGVLIALLMDIRDELQTLNKTLKEASIFVNGKVG